MRFVCLFIQFTLILLKAFGDGCPLGGSWGFYILFTVVCMRFGMLDTTNLPPCRQKQFGHTVYYPQFDPENYKTSYTERMAQLVLPIIDNIKSCQRDIQIAMKHNGKTHQEAKILIAEFVLSNVFFYYFGF